MILTPRNFVSSLLFSVILILIMHNTLEGLELKITQNSVWNHTMSNELTQIKLHGKNFHLQVALSLRKTVAKQELTVRKVLLCFGGINRESSTMSSPPTVKHLIRTCTVNNYTVWRKQSPSSGQLWSIGEKLSCISATPSHTHRYI